LRRGESLNSFGSLLDEVGEELRGRINEAGNDDFDDEAQRQRSVLMAASREVTVIHIN